MIILSFLTVGCWRLAGVEGLGFSLWTYLNSVECIFLSNMTHQLVIKYFSQNKTVSATR